MFDVFEFYRKKGFKESMKQTGTELESYKERLGNSLNDRALPTKMLSGKWSGAL